MTSVVDTSVKHFHSGMFAAPVLNGVAGALLGVLNACLITGFDTKTATSLVVAGGVATLSFSGSHSATVDSVVLLSGSSIDALNGEQKVTAIGSGVVRFATAAPDGAASGTITFKMAPAGWTQPFNGTNIATYKSADPASTGMILRVDDTGTTSCRLRGYETMTDVNTGTGLFPLDSQISGGGYMNKSNTASVAAITWIVVADGRGIYINIAGYSSVISTVVSGRTVFIGDFAPGRPGGDPYAFLIGCSTNGNHNDANGTCDQSGSVSYYAPRAYHGLGSSVGQTPIPETGGMSISGMDSFYGPFPSKIDGGMRLSRRYVADAVGSEPRGVLPGLFTIPQYQVGLTIAPGVHFAGTGPMAGRKLRAIGCGSNSASYPSLSLGISMIDVTGPWR